jgi:hypothetical protein
VARRTYLERRFPTPPLFQTLAQEWCADQSASLLRLAWDAYDRLKKDHFEQLPLSHQDERKEETLNQLLALAMDQCKNRFAPFSIIHEVPEQTARKGGRSQSPHPDIGFCFYDNPRAVWPLEGKVLDNDRNVAAYSAEVNANFLTGRYATFSNEGAMIGYLLSGKPDIAFANIELGISSKLSDHNFIRDRAHKVSDHNRGTQPHPGSPIVFLCHHLILEIDTTP